MQDYVIFTVCTRFYLLSFTRSRSAWMRKPRAPVRINLVFVIAQFATIPRNIYSYDSF